MSYAADGDSRELKAMPVSTQLLSSSLTSSSGSFSSLLPCCNKISIPQNWTSWFVMKRPTSVAYIQDMVHLAVKLKSRLLKPSIILPLGKYTAGGHHLRLLHNTFSKDQHGLREKDINHKDKQNFEAVLRITSDSVMQLLTNVRDAKGTSYDVASYLRIMKLITESFLNKNLESLVRIENVWYAVFLLRYWHQWIVLNPDYNLSDHFITSNAYTCVELNAHSLLTLVISIQTTLQPHSKSFLP